MKKINILFICIAVFSISFLSCKKQDLQPFNTSPAINFVKIEKVDSIAYSFATNPTNEYIQELPVTIIGDSANVDRTFNVEVVNDPKTTALPAQYEILGGVVPAGKFTGKLSIRLLNSPALDTKMVSVKLRLIDSKDFKMGNIESSQFTVHWTNQIVLPSWSFYRYYFTSVGSNSVYRIILKTTGLASLTSAQHTAIGPAGVQAMATVFGDYVKQWNKDHPKEEDKLKHDSGTQKGLEIVPLYYTHSKFD